MPNLGATDQCVPCVRRQPVAGRLTGVAAAQIGAVLVHMLMETAEIVPYPRDALGRVVDDAELAPALAPVKAFWRRTEFQPDGRRTGTVYCHDEVLRQVSAAEEARARAARLRVRSDGKHGLFDSPSVCDIPGHLCCPGLSQPLPGALQLHAFGALPQRMRVCLSARMCALPDKCGRAQGTRDAMMPQFMPMVVPSRPWTHYDRGGHLLSDQEVVRLHGNSLQREALKIADSLPLQERAISQARPPRRPTASQRARPGPREASWLMVPHAHCFCKCHGNCSDVSFVTSLAVHPCSVVLGISDLCRLRVRAGQQGCRLLVVSVNKVFQPGA